MDLYYFYIAIIKTYEELCIQFSSIYAILKKIIST